MLSNYMPAIFDYNSAEAFLVCIVKINHIKCILNGSLLKANIISHDVQKNPKYKNANL